MDLTNLEDIGKHQLIPMQTLRDRQIFHNEKQTEHESVAEWFSRLFGLAKSCRYGGISEFFLIERFMLGLRENTFDLLCMQEDPMAFTDVYQIAAQLQMQIQDVDLDWANEEVVDLGIDTTENVATENVATENVATENEATENEANENDATEHDATEHEYCESDEPVIVVTKEEHFRQYDLANDMPSAQIILNRLDTDEDIIIADDGDKSTNVSVMENYGAGRYRKKVIGKLSDKLKDEQKLNTKIIGVNENTMRCEDTIKNSMENLEISRIKSETKSAKKSVKQSVKKSILLPETKQIVNKENYEDSVMDLHVRTHSHAGKKSYDRKKCHKSFNMADKLKEHQSIHSDGAKKFPCLICGSSFSRKTRLTEHTLLHVDVHSFKCNMCPKVYRHTGGLQIHLKNHQKISDKAFLKKQAKKSKPKATRPQYRFNTLKKEKVFMGFLNSDCETKKQTSDF